MIKNMMDTDFNITKHRTIALIAIFEATHIAACYAQGKTTLFPALASQQTALIKSIFILNPQNIDEIYPHPNLFSDGMDLLETLFLKNQKRYDPDVMRYAFNLLQIERLAERKPHILNDLGSKLTQLSSKLTDYESLESPELIAELAKIYVSTVGTLKVRVQVKGSPELLQQPSIADHIRTALLTGFRAAHLWRQLGGRKWQLLLHRNKIIQAIKSIN